MRIKPARFGASTKIFLAPSQVEYRTRTPQGDRVIKVFLLNPDNPRVMAWTEKYAEGIKVDPYALLLNDWIAIVYDAFRRLERPVPLALQSFSLESVFTHDTKLVSGTPAISPLAAELPSPAGDSSHDQA
jgi:hypothetical protein